MPETYRKFWRREWDSKNAAELFPSQLEKSILMCPHYNYFPVVQKLSFSIVIGKTKTRYLVHGGTRAEQRVADSKSTSTPRLKVQPKNGKGGFNFRAGSRGGW
jgi:hypothetical protein